MKALHNALLFVTLYLFSLSLLGQADFPGIAFQEWNEVCGLRTDDLPKEKKCFSIFSIITKMQDKGESIPSIEETGRREHLRIFSISGDQINQAIDWASDMSNGLMEDNTLVQITFPAGIYQLSHTININPANSNISLVGAGSDQTFFERLSLFNNRFDGGHTFFIHGDRPGNGPLIDIPLDSSTGTVPNGQNISDQLASAEWVQILRDDIPSTECSATGGNRNSGVGQIIKVESVDRIANQIEFASPARLAYPEEDNSRVLPFKPVENFGIECIHLGYEHFASFSLSTDPSVKQTNIHIEQSVNCWVRGVNSYYTQHRHINVQRSSNIEITGNYIHHAANHGSGGFGYGVSLEISSGECLIENNIFYSLRHAMLVQFGANGNAFLNNYSERRYSSQVPFSLDYSKLGDISVHGRFPFANLFEGNIIEKIDLDHYHGASGPGNTFFRNHTTKASFHAQWGSYHSENGCSGFETDFNNVIGNDFSDNIRITTGIGHIVECNFENNNSVSSDCNSFSVVPSSLFRTGRPNYAGLDYFYGGWPTIGPNTNRWNRNPALDRWESEKKKKTFARGCTSCKEVQETGEELTISPVVTPCMVSVSNTGVKVTPGRIDLNIEGGALPYSYQWTILSGGPIVENFGSAIRANSGTYRVVVTDALGNVLEQTFTIFCSNTKSLLTERSSVEEISIFPNPTSSGKIQISLNPSLLQGEILILNTQGRLVKKVSHLHLNHQFTVDISDLASGVYFFRLLYDKEIVTNKVILTQ